MNREINAVLVNLRRAEGVAGDGDDSTHVRAAKLLLAQVGVHDIQIMPCGCPRPEPSASHHSRLRLAARDTGLPTSAAPALRRARSEPPRATNHQDDPFANRLPGGRSLGLGLQSAPRPE